MKDIIRSILEDSLRIKRAGIEHHLDTLMLAAQALTDCINRRHRIFIFGNGGSAADAQHLAAEFVNRFRIERSPLPAIALTTDTSVLTSIGNDYSFDDVFAKQISALGTKGDLAWGISTSGNSKNVVKALDASRGLGMTTLGMTGRGGQIASLSDLLLTVDAENTARIQETHITMGHILCELVDRLLYPDQF
jgi:D-sedoheptulose 7-phosphate isomerase